MFARPLAKFCVCPVSQANIEWLYADALALQHQLLLLQLAVSVFVT